MNIIDTLENQTDIRKIEFPTLYTDLNVLLAELVGWPQIVIEKDIVMVSDDITFNKVFNFQDDSVIYPIAHKFNISAVSKNNEWHCNYKNKSLKEMLVVAQNEKVALAMAIVFECCF